MAEEPEWVERYRRDVGQDPPGWGPPPPRLPGHRLSAAGSALIGFGKVVMGLGLLLVIAAVAFSLLRG